MKLKSYIFAFLFAALVLLGQVVDNAYMSAKQSGEPSFLLGIITGLLLLLAVLFLILFSLSLEQTKPK